MFFLWRLWNYSLLNNAYEIFRKYRDNQNLTFSEKHKFLRFKSL